MTHRYRRYARRIGITSSLKELRHYSATQLLTAGTDLNTVAGRLGHAAGSTTLRFYAQFTRSADRYAAGVIPAQLNELRKKERLRELYRQHAAALGANNLIAIANIVGPQAGIDPGYSASMVYATFSIYTSNDAIKSVQASLIGTTGRHGLL